MPAEPHPSDERKHQSNIGLGYVIEKSLHTTKATLGGYRKGFTTNEQEAQERPRRKHDIARRIRHRRNSPQPSTDHKKTITVLSGREVAA